MNASSLSKTDNCFNGFYIHSELHLSSYCEWTSQGAKLIVYWVATYSKQSVYLASHWFTVSGIYSRLLAVCCTFSFYIDFYFSFHTFCLSFGKVIKRHRNIFIIPIIIIHLENITETLLLISIIHFAMSFYISRAQGWIIAWNCKWQLQ